MTRPLLYPEIPERLVFHRVGPGVYDTPCGRVTLYRVPGVYPPAWNVEWMIDYQNHLATIDDDYSLGALAQDMLVDGAATKRDALALAHQAWPTLRYRLLQIEGA